jgi:hypothetical protein
MSYLYKCHTKKIKIKTKTRSKNPQKLLGPKNSEVKSSKLLLGGDKRKHP